MKWYLTLDIHSKINAKECFEFCCGVKFSDLSYLFSFEERINILHSKLKLDGFDIP
jgi:hypothetical protein